MPGEGCLKSHTRIPTSYSIPAYRVSALSLPEKSIESKLCQESTVPSKNQIYHQIERGSDLRDALCEREIGRSLTAWAVTRSSSWGVRSKTRGVYPGVEHFVCRSAAMGGLSCYEPFLSGLVAGGYRRVVLPNKDRAGRRAVAGF